MRWALHDIHHYSLETDCGISKSHCPTWASSCLKMHAVTGKKYISKQACLFRMTNLDLLSKMITVIAIWLVTPIVAFAEVRCCIHLCVFHCDGQSELMPIYKCPHTCINKIVQKEEIQREDVLTQKQKKRWWLRKRHHFVSLKYMHDSLNISQFAKYKENQFTSLDCQG